MRWDYGRGKGAFYVKHMSRADRYAGRRMAADGRMRLRIAITALPRSPQTSAAHLVYLAGMLAGAAEWQAAAQARRAGRRSPPD